ncbi:DUF2817 domain-containing protein [Streptomyces olivoreticuli]
MTHHPAQHFCATCAPAHRTFLAGTAPTCSHRVLRDVVTAYTAGAEAVAHVDLHTGSGERAHDEPVFRDGRDPGAPDRARAWYGPALTVSSDGTAGSTPITGDTAGLVADILGDGPPPTATTLEMGTTAGPEALTALRADNRLWLHPGHRPALAEGIGRRMSAAFSPDDPGWRDAVPRAGTGVLHAALAGLTPEVRPRPARP